MHPALRARGKRSRYLILSAILLVLTGWSARLAGRAFDALALVLTLCAAVLILLALRGSSRSDR